MSHPLHNRVLNMLTSLPWTRERRQKDIALVRLLTSHWTKTIVPSESALIDLVKDYDSANRLWRKCLEEHESLRGHDYKDKKVYEQKKQIELGMESGFHDLSTMDNKRD